LGATCHKKIEQHLSSKEIKIDRFKIFAPTWWEDVSNSNPEGPYTIVDGRLDEPGVLQFSTAEYIRGLKPNPTYEDLIEMSEKVGIKNDFGRVTHRSSGNCKLGKYGVVEFSSDKFPYISVWHLSNGKDFVLATFICSKNPEPSEIRDVKEILVTMKKKNLFF
jgi:hypothetical protein